MMNRCCCTLASCLLLAAFAPEAGAASFTGLGDLPGGAFQSLGRGLSGDATTVVGYSQSADSAASRSNGEAFRWTAGTGLQPLGDLPGGLYQSFGDATSRDGTVVVGESNGSSVEPFRWTASGGMVGLGLPGAYPRAATADVSADGSVVVGNGLDFSLNQEAFVWTESGGYDLLGFLPGGTSSRSVGISGDGSVIAGVANSTEGQVGFRWTEATGMTPLGLVPGQTSTFPRGISDDGSVIVGVAGGVGWSWTLGGGFVDLGSFWPQAASADGSVLAGFRSRAQGGGAYFSHPLLGDRWLEEYLEARGIDLTGWELTEVSAISDDGLTLVGHGRGPNGTEAWIASIVPEPSTGLLFLAALGLTTTRRTKR